MRPLRPGRPEASLCRRCRAPIPTHGLLRLFMLHRLPARPLPATLQWEEVVATPPVVAAARTANP